MTHTITDHTELPLEADAGRQRVTYYVRSMSDKGAMIHGKNGDIYRRADGQPWKEQGFQNFGTHLQLASAWADWSDT